ncbi:hypothetical protein EUGRSUZ_C03526 [Eucalyptus grandis]|uniref:Cytochrome c assembly protein domain-containing protein n=2 Tax=Eucalyptus grandis TaxID=71139 RepID=A0A059CUT0_EUCGR|nr:hypothetical protein EUGRSUZ_C03526 [Eucalyptus grandis]
MIATFFCITGLLVTHWIYSGHFPLSDLYESLIFLSWSFSVIHMVLYFKKHKNYLSTITAPTLLCGSLLSVALLVITLQKAIRVFSKKSNFLNESFSFVKIQYMNEISNVLLTTSFCSSQNYYRARLIQQLDQWSYHIISLRFIFLTIGILSGAVWANEAWGSYWNWDPKETWAFITWTLFAIYLHTHIIVTWF